MRCSREITVRILSGFDDPWLANGTWDRVHLAGQSRSLFLTEAYQRVWWSCFGRGRLLLLGVEWHDTPMAIAPLFVDGGMAFLVGSGGSDCLDLIGDLSKPGLVPLLLATAMDTEPELIGFRFYLVPDVSPTAAHLRDAAEALGLSFREEGCIGAPVLDFEATPHTRHDVTHKKSLLRHERKLLRDGELTVQHMVDGDAIAERLEAFFDQHVARWDGTDSPSLFIEPPQRKFYREMARHLAPMGWIRFTEVTWNQQLVAAHFGFCMNGVYLWYKPSFDPVLAKYSPGEVMLLHLLRSAITEGVHRFDFGIGEEIFKSRFATSVPQMCTWGLYRRGFSLS